MISFYQLLQVKPNYFDINIYDNYIQLYSCLFFVQSDNVFIYKLYMYTTKIIKPHLYLVIDTFKSANQSQQHLL